MPIYSQCVELSNQFFFLVKNVKVDKKRCMDNFFLQKPVKEVGLMSDNHICYALY